MRITLETRTPDSVAVDLLALPLPQLDPDHWHLPSRAAALDRAMGGCLSRVLASGDFRGKREESLLLYPENGLKAQRLLLLGLGEEARIDLEGLRRLAGRAVREGSRRRTTRAALILPPLRRLRGPQAVQALAEGAVLAAYRFDRYRTAAKEDAGRLGSLAILVERGAALSSLRSAAGTGVHLAESQNMARDLSNESPSVLTPAGLAREATRMARDVGLGSRVLGVAELRKRRMGAILAVGQGSSNTPRMIVLEHNAPARSRTRARKRSVRKRPTVCLVGKGITFDSGGLSIKPSTAMVAMKHDMSGGAAVVGALRAAALLHLPLHVVGVVGSAENMPSGTAYRPDDVVTTMSGQTVEISNTDAEGRLLLADTLHFARTEFEPDAMVDVATLTGACSVALGKWASAVLATNERLSEALRRAGEATGERLWPLPLWEEHREHMRGKVGDVRQTGGRDGGTITAAAFLSHFVGNVPWAHLDIASTANTDRTGPYQPHGATGVGVRLLIEFLRGWRDAKIV